jgi:hypothetical protein
MGSELSKHEVRRVLDSIKRHAERLDEKETDLAIESAGVAQAVDSLRRALDQVEDRLKNRQYEAVANLGYRDVASEFIFLQRTMGSLLTAAHRRSSLISDIAGETRLCFEDVEPIVEEERRRAEESEDSGGQLS